MLKWKWHISKRDINWLIGILLLLVFIIVFCFVPLKTVSYTVTEKYQATETYYVTEPYTVREPYTVQEPYNRDVDRSTTLFSGTSISVYPGDSEEVSRYIDTADKTSARIEGNVRAVRGGEFIFKLYDDRGYRYVDPGRVTNYRFSISPRRTGRYYFHFSNTFSIITTKYIRLDATYYWHETVTEYRTVTKYKEVTKYRDVPKQRTVWRERPVTRFKNVSILEYLTSY